jgi:hypothetical protein
MVMATYDEGDDSREVLDEEEEEMMRHGGGEAGSNFKVVLRVRPPLHRELQGDRHFQQIAKFQGNDSIIVSENLEALEDPKEAGNFSSYAFTFDHVYSQDSNQASVYNNTARDAVLSSLSGYNATIIAYGQTGTGKTYTMEGEPEPKLRGIIPRATEEIFGYIQNASSERKKFLVRASYLQIYNEVISDLLKPERTNLSVREDKKRGVFVEGLSEWVVRSPKEVYGLMQRGALTRCTANTKMNEISSRSHAVFIIIAEQLEYLDAGQEGEPGHTFKVVSGTRTRTRTDLTASCVSRISRKPLGIISHIFPFQGLQGPSSCDGHAPSRIPEPSCWKPELFLKS